MNIAPILFGLPWIFYWKVHNDKEANTYTFLWNGKRVMLVPMNSIASSSFTSSPSTEKSQKEQTVETEVMTAPQVKPEDIKDDVKEQVHGKDDFVSTNNIDQGNVNQELLKVEDE